MRVADACLVVYVNENKQDNTKKKYTDEVGSNQEAKARGRACRGNSP